MQWVRSGNWSSWKPGKKHLSRWLSHIIKCTMKLHPFQHVQHVCTSLWKSCAWGSWGRNEWKESGLCCACSTQAGWAKALLCTQGLGSPLPEWPRAHRQSTLECALVHSQQEHRLNWMTAPVRRAPVACWSGGKVWGLVALCLEWNGKDLLSPAPLSLLPP